MFVIFAIQMDYLISHITTKLKLGIYLKKVGILILLTTIIINVRNRYTIMHKIHETGGRGYSSNQLNELAYDALDRKSEGTKEIYLFPEKGFYTNFSYLTHNEIPYWVCDVNEQDIKYFQNKGYEKFVICYWDSNNAEKYRQALKKTVSGELHEKVYYQRDGEAAFYMISS